MADFLSYFAPFYYAIESLMKSPIISYLKMISLLLSLILLFGIIYISIKSRLLQEKIFRIQTFFQGSKYEKKRVLKIWKKILKLIQEKEPASQKLALLLADELFEEILERSGWPGKNFEERIAKITPIQIPYLEKIKTAHFLVQKFIEDPEFPLKEKEAWEILEVYEKIFKHFGVLE